MVAEPGYEQSPIISVVLQNPLGCTPAATHDCYTADVPEAPLEITVRDTKALLDRGEPLLLIDVREPEEHATARIEGAELIPMGSVPQRVMHFEDRDEPVILFCHHGVRSLHVAAWLRERGVENAQSMAGGIDQWSREIDPSVPRY